LAAGFSYRDVGVVVLDTLVALASYAHLPSVGLVDSLAKKSPLD
jgi:hypothetical protein